MIGNFSYTKKKENNSFSLNLGIRYKFDEKDLGIPTFCCIINDSRDVPWRIPTIFFMQIRIYLPKNRANGPSIVSAKAAVRVDATGVGTCAFGIVRVVCVERTRPIATVRAYAF